MKLLVALRFFSAVAALFAVSSPVQFAQAFITDNKPDIIWQHPSGIDAYWYFPAPGNPALRSGVVITPQMNPDWKMVGKGDFDKDGQIDILWRNSSNGDNAVWLMNGPQIREGVLLTPLADLNWRVGGVADFNGDGFLDIVWRNYSTGQNAIWYLNGPKGTQLLNGLGIDVYNLDLNWKIAAAADFNRDGKPEIVWFNTLTGKTALWYMKSNPGGSWNNLLDRTGWITDSAGVALTVKDKDYRIVGTPDFNGDGKTDILWRHSSLGMNLVWYLNGTVFSSAAYLTSELDSGWRVAGQDLDESPWRLDAEASVLLNDAPGLNYDVITATAVPDPNGTTGKIVLKRKYDSRGFTIQRKLPTDQNWTTRVSGNRVLDYQETGLPVGQRYQYRAFPDGVNPDNPNDLYAPLYKERKITTGINLRPGDSLLPNESRGKISLLVDQSYAGPLSVELDTLVKDLVGDGWKVLRHDIRSNRLHDDDNWNNNRLRIVSLRSTIHSDYLAGSVGVFIIGHLAIPYSGNGGDGHPDHAGAWPTDLYYGDDTQTVPWTDTLLADTGIYEANKNRVGDGKFDNNFLPSPLELFVGRIDFTRMSVFAPKTDVDLTRQYLNKNHRFRHNQLKFDPRTTVFGFYGPLQEGPYDHYIGSSRDVSIYNNASRLGSRCFGFGQGKIVAGDLFFRRISSLVGLQSGPGGFNGINDPTAGTYGPASFAHYSSDLADPNKEPSVGFYVLFGSYMADWNVPNNFLRATVAAPNSGLATVYGNITWLFADLGSGDPIGISQVVTSKQSAPTPREISITGDPTLRLQYTAPVSNLARNNNELTWTAGEPGCQYFVYRSSSGDIQGDFLRLTPKPLPETTTRFTDSNPPPSTVPRLYQVRALKQVFTASGSYTNLSTGVFQN